MNSQGITQFEREIIEHILKKECPQYLKHLPLLMVDSRENTGIGYYIYFKYLEEPFLTPSVHKTLGKSVYAEIEGLEGGAGFMLYIDEGRITMLESFCHCAENWPDHITNFSIKDL